MWELLHTCKGFQLLRGMLKLRELSLDSADIGDESIEVLASMPALHRVNLYHTTFTEAGIARLKKALPNCEITWDRDSAKPNRRKT